MTENRLYAIGGSDFCDSSSNSSNLLKFELFSSGSDCGAVGVGIGSGDNNSINTIRDSNSIQPQYTILNTLRESPMLTTASISIPQRNSSGMNYPSSKMMADFSEFGLDALEVSSLSPNLLQDVNLNSISSIHNQFNVSGVNSSNSGNPMQYENQNQTSNSSAMWNDIGSAMTMKSEPFHLDDDYIFQIDKADLIQGPTLAELNDEALLEDLIIDDLIPVEQGYAVTTGGQLSQIHFSPGQLNMSETALPPQQLLQHHHHHNSPQQQRQTQTQLSLQLQSTSGREGPYDEQNTTGSSSPFDIYHTTPTKSLNSSAAFSPGSQASSSSPLLLNSVTPPPHTSRGQYHHSLQSQQHGKTRSPALQELLKKEYSMSPDRHILGQSVPDPSTPRMYIAGGSALSPASSGFGSGGRRSIAQCSSGASASRLSSSAPTHLGLEQIWQRREPRQHLLSTGSLAEAESFSSISTGSVLSPEGNDLSHDEGYSDFDSDRDEDYSTDNDSDNDDGPRIGSHGSGKGKERYFWQYNVQAKGPKGQRLVIKSELEDPHVLNEATDPVFSPNCSVRGIKHSGKARKGDGNDLTPNPKKLHIIGKELDKLGRIINDMTPVSELPFNVRPKSRKEKNKLASRACRLKKKAQHEANKIKLYGLEVEHRKLLNGIRDVKRILAIKYKNPNENIDELNQQIERIAKNSTKLKIAGTSTEFVNKILDKVKSGVPRGGLEDIQNS